MKPAMVVFEAITFVLLLASWLRRACPPARVLVYAWHPLPIWEFAGSGHIDAALIAFVVAGARGLGAAATGWARRAVPRRRDPDQILPGVAAAGALSPLGLADAGGFCVAMAARLPAVFSASAGGVLGFLPGYASEEGFAQGRGFLPVELAAAPAGLAACRRSFISLAAAATSWPRSPPSSSSAAVARRSTVRRCGAAGRHVHGSAVAALSLVFRLADRLCLLRPLAVAAVVDQCLLSALPGAGRLPAGRASSAAGRVGRSTGRLRSWRSAISGISPARGVRSS